MKHIIHRLLSAASDAKLRRDMNVEDEYFCMRIISDSPGAGHNNAVQYDNFWAAAPEHTFALVKKLLLAL